MPSSTLEVLPPKLVKKAAQKLHARVQANLAAGIKKLEAVVLDLDKIRAGDGFHVLGFTSMEAYIDKHVTGVMNRATLFRRLANLEFKRETPALAGIPQSHAAALAAVPAEDRAEVYAAAGTNAGGDVTTADVQAAVEEYQDENEEAEIVDQAPSSGRGSSSRSSGGKPASNAKRDAYIAKLEQVLGKREIADVKSGTVQLSDAQLKDWSTMSDDAIREIAELVLDKRQDPKKAHKWLNELVDGYSQVRDLQNRANSKRDVGIWAGTIDGALVVVMTRKDIVADGHKFLKRVHPDFAR